MKPPPMFSGEAAAEQYNHALWPHGSRRSRKERADKAAGARKRTACASFKQRESNRIRRIGEIQVSGEGRLTQKNAAAVILWRQKYSPFDIFPYHRPDFIGRIRHDFEAACATFLSVSRISEQTTSLAPIKIYSANP